MAAEISAGCLDDGKFGRGSETRGKKIKRLRFDRINTRLDRRKER